MPPSRLADEIGMTRGAITKLADRLIAKSLIVRKANRDDGRAQTLALTASGQEDGAFAGHTCGSERCGILRRSRQRPSAARWSGF